MNKKEAFEKLHTIGQQHLLAFFDQLSSGEQERLLTQIKQIDIPTFRRQQQLLATTHTQLNFLEPITDTATADRETWETTGRKLAAEGKVGCLIIAGGQGTRFRFPGPKGAFPVSLIKGKSLFQIFAEKTAAAGIVVERPQPLAIMTSPRNHEETVHFFEKNHFFGLKPEHLHFFSQRTLPLLDEKGNLFLEEPHVIANGPDGNGNALHHFFASGLWDLWHSKGVRFLITVLIDNPLADPFDATLVGFHQEMNADVVVKCTTRNDPKEKVGVLLRQEDKVRVIEYTELPIKEREARDEKGELKYSLANLSLFSFSMEFIKTISKKELPLHKAYKAAKNLHDQQPQEPNAWKFETFIFDILQYANRVKTLVYPRERCFAPLKNASGQDSLATVQAALLARDREVFQKISGSVPADRLFELSQSFYYPTEKFRAYWKDRSLPDQSYIE